jgi:hypothetical protein
MVVLTRVGLDDRLEGPVTPFAIVKPSKADCLALSSTRLLLLMKPFKSFADAKISLHGEISKV